MMPSGLQTCMLDYNITYEDSCVLLLAHTHQRINKRQLTILSFSPLQYFDHKLVRAYCLISPVNNYDLQHACS